MHKEKYELIKKENDLIKKANLLVTELFKDKFDKQGKPYINHLYFVFNNVETEDEKTVALLHDVIEDTNINGEDLKKLGFPEHIVKSLLILTRNEQIEYSKYIDSIIESNDLVALKVKKADMMHNMDKDRLESLDLNTRKRLEEKYIKNYEKIVNNLKKRGIK